MSISAVGSDIRDTSAAAEQLLEYGIPVMLISPRKKTPVPSLIPDPTAGKSTWEIIDNPCNAESTISNVQIRYGSPNLAAIVGRVKGSPVLSVDIDGSTGLELAPTLGLSRGLNDQVTDFLLSVPPPGEPIVENLY